MNNRSISLTDKPIFIVGAARSGTTLLQYMLRSHPQLSFPTAESHFIIPFYNRRDTFGDLSELKNLQILIEKIYQSRQRFFDEDLHGMVFDPQLIAEKLYAQQLTTLPDIFSAIFRENAQGEGKSRWGDKTPYYILHLETILEIFPDAQIIHLIRDGRDCSISMLERKWDLQIFNYYHAAYTWKKYVNSGKAFGQKYPGYYFELRYEDILNQPTDLIKQLCRFLNIEFNDSVINFKKAQGSGKTALLSKPLQKRNQAKWKTALSTKQLSVFESLAGDTLKECGYELNCNNPSINQWDWFANELEIKYSHFYSKYFL